MMNGFDPSKMDPKVMMQMAELVRQLPPDKISRMQTLMHNMMAGFDVKKDMEEFEQSLPQGFREKLVSIMGSSGLGAMGPSAPPVEEMSDIASRSSGRPNHA
jgi:GTP-sensing pleiotropic transcriptional regulator CodY